MSNNYNGKNIKAPPCSINAAAAECSPCSPSPVPALQRHRRGVLPSPGPARHRCLRGRGKDDGPAPSSVPLSPSAKTRATAKPAGGPPISTGVVGGGMCARSVATAATRTICYGTCAPAVAASSSCTRTASSSGSTIATRAGVSTWNCTSNQHLMKLSHNLGLCQNLHLCFPDFAPVARHAGIRIYFIQMR